MYKHHEDSIVKMTEYYRENPEIIALFLIGSVATQTERPDSDLDGVAVVSPEYYAQKAAGVGTMEVVHGKCTYEAGYFDIHYLKGHYERARRVRFRADAQYVLLRASALLRRRRADPARKGH